MNAAQKAWATRRARAGLTSVPPISKAAKASPKVKATPSPDRVPLATIDGGIRIDAADLRSLAAKVAPAVSRRATLPALGGIRLSLGRRAAAIMLEGTDLEVATTARLGAAKVAPVAIIDAKMLASAARLLAGAVTIIVARKTGEAPGPVDWRAPCTCHGHGHDGSDLCLQPDCSCEDARTYKVGLPGKPVTITTAVVTLADARRTFELRGLPLEDFPDLAVPTEQVAEIDGAVLATALARLATVASTDETRPVLTGILFDLTNRKDAISALVATDSYRLGQIQLAPDTITLDASVQTRGGGDVRFVIPRGAELAKLLQASTGRVRILRSDAAVAFDLGGIIWSTRLIEGEFPNYPKLLEVATTSTIRTDGAALVEMIRAMAPWGHDGSPIRIEASGAGITAKIGSQDAGSLTEQVAAELDGDDVAFAVNGAYLHAGLRFVGSPKVTISLGSPVKPILITSPDTPGAIYLQMPVRI